MKELIAQIRAQYPTNSPLLEDLLQLEREMETRPVDSDLNVEDLAVIAARYDVDLGGF